MKLPMVLSLMLLSLVACGGGDPQMDTPTPQIGLSTTAQIESKGGGGGGGTAPTPPTTPPGTPGAPAPAPGGGTQVPPHPTTDGPAWFFNNESSITTVGFSPNIDFGRIENMTAGGIPIGSTRSATELIYNVSKKTALTVTNIQITGANPGDFYISPQSIAAAETTVLPANKGAAEALQISFIPTAKGTRNANVVFTSVAGTVQITLTGVGLSARPILSGLAPVTFLPTSAPITFIVQNTGGSSLFLNTIGIGGANPNAFQLTVANSGQGNCFAGVPLAPLSYCYLAVGLAPGAVPPASATLVIQSNDPVNPQTSVPLTLATSF